MRRAIVKSGNMGRVAAFIVRLGFLKVVFFVRLVHRFAFVVLLLGGRGFGFFVGLARRNFAVVYFVFVCVFFGVFGAVLCAIAVFGGVRCWVFVVLARGALRVFGFVFFVFVCSFIICRGFIFFGVFFCVGRYEMRKCEW